MLNESVNPEQKLVVGMVLFPGLTLLDLIGPLTVLAYHSTIYLVSSSLEPVTSDQGAQLVPNCDYDGCPVNLDILFIPGGDGVVDAMVDPALLSFVKTRGQNAGYVTSVCTGALILAAAGLLEGFDATTHWAWHDVLKTFGANPVAKRVVIDRNRVTGGGVTAGIDFGLSLLAHLRGELAAQTRQLMIEYDPNPPFESGSPEKAEPKVIELAEKLLNAAAERQIVIQRQNRARP